MLLENIIIDKVATLPTARSRKSGKNVPMEIANGSDRRW